MLAQLFELGAVASELLALGLDHLRRRLGDETLVAELALGALDLRRAARRVLPRSGSTCSAVDRPTARISIGPIVVSAARPRPPAPAAPASRTNSDTSPPMRASRTAAGGTPTRSRQRRTWRTRWIPLSTDRAPRCQGATGRSREARDDKQLPAIGQVAPDLLGHERHDRMGRASTCSSTKSRFAAASSIAVVEARLDDLQIPVAELRPEERVEVQDRVGEVVIVDALATDSIALCSRDRIQRSSRRSVRGSGEPSALSRISREAFHILFARSRPCWIRSTE